MAAWADVPRAPVRSGLGKIRGPAFLKASGSSKLACSLWSLSGAAWRPPSPYAYGVLTPSLSEPTSLARCVLQPAIAPEPRLAILRRRPRGYIRPLFAQENQPPVSALAPLS
jgi:hypothetical protein